jgi:hypothetical protein
VPIRERLVFLPLSFGSSSASLSLVLSDEREPVSEIDDQT